MCILRKVFYSAFFSFCLGEFKQQQLNFEDKMVYVLNIQETLFKHQHHSCKTQCPSPLLLPESCTLSSLNAVRPSSATTFNPVVFETRPCKDVGTTVSVFSLLGWQGSHFVSLIFLWGDISQKLPWVQAGWMAFLPALFLLHVGDLAGLAGWLDCAAGNDGIKKISVLIQIQHFLL